MSLKNKKRDFEQTEIYKKIKISESKGYYDLVIGEVQSGKTTKTKNLRKTKQKRKSY